LIFIQRRRLIIRDIARIERTLHGQSNAAASGAAAPALRPQQPAARQRYQIA
jgi:hypothetical protein